MPPTSSALKKQPLTLAQISTYDDILTDALVDHVRGTSPQFKATKLPGHEQD